jgi:hypothetical protein
MGTLGTFANFQVQTPNTKIVILSEACTKGTSSKKGTVSCTGALFTCFACGVPPMYHHTISTNSEPVADYQVLT